MVESPSGKPVATLKTPPRSLAKAATAISRATSSRIHEQVEYKGWWLFSKDPLPKDQQGFRFHDGYGLKPGTREVYAFGFW